MSSRPVYRPPPATFVARAQRRIVLLGAHFRAQPRLSHLRTHPLPASELSRSSRRRCASTIDFPPGLDLAAPAGPTIERRAIIGRDFWQAEGEIDWARLGPDRPDRIGADEPAAGRVACGRPGHEYLFPGADHLPAGLHIGPESSLAPATMIERAGGRLKIGPQMRAQ